MKSLYKALCKLEVIICGIFLIVVVSLVFLSAAARKFNIPMQESLDIAQLLFAWLSFIGADIALRNEKLVGVDLLTKKFSEKTQLIIKIFCYLLILIILGVFVVKGFQLSIQNYSRSFQTLKLSYSFVTLSLPVGSSLMILSAISILNKDIKNLRSMLRKG